MCESNIQISKPGQSPAAPDCPKASAISTASLGGLLGIRHPLWMCGLRPFFLLAGLVAPLFMLIWLASLLGLSLSMPQAVGGTIVWHVHELLFGFVLATVTGFMLTIVPEFAGGSDFSATVVRRLVVCWVVGRIAFWSTDWIGTPALAISGAAHLVLVGGLIWLALPRLRQGRGRQHLGFLWGLVGLALCIAGFYFDALRNEYPMRWLHAALGVVMMLIIVALSRISMRIVNFTIQEAGVIGVEYRARPPRRMLAIACIGLYTAVEFFHPGTSLSGWFALVAAAAMLNLLRDWQVGRVLFRHRPLMFFGVYVSMAAGYATMGAALVFGVGAFNAGLHLLTIGAAGLAIYTVMSIAGRGHCGHRFENRLWTPLGAGLLVTAALLRACAYWPGIDAQVFWLAAGGLWCTAFGLFSWHTARLLLTARPDGRIGC